MELMYPVVTIICFIFAMIICFGNLKKQKKYTEGKKVANTKYIKETEYYKLKVKKIECKIAFYIFISFWSFQRELNP